MWTVRCWPRTVACVNQSCGKDPVWRVPSAACGKAFVLISDSSEMALRLWYISQWDSACNRQVLVSRLAYSMRWLYVMVGGRRFKLLNNSSGMCETEYLRHQTKNSNAWLLRSEGESTELISKWSLVQMNFNETCLCILGVFGIKG
jgi:hypothetical protein